MRAMARAERCSRLHLRQPLDPAEDLARALLVGRQPELPLGRDVGTGPEPGNRRQVVRRDRGQRLLGILRRRILLEPEQAVRQDLSARQLGAGVLLDRPEIFADDHRPGALALDRDDGQQVARVAPDVGAVARGSMPSGIQNRRKSPIT